MTDKTPCRNLSNVSSLGQSSMSGLAASCCTSMKRHLPLAPRPGFLHLSPDCRYLAAQRGRAASTARALAN